MKRLLQGLFVACLAGIAACGSSDAAAPAPAVFVAFSNSFDGYHDWHTFPVTMFTVEEGIHAAGKRTEYIQNLPPHGATEFPLGTIIIKEIAADEAAMSRTFAMVKRGGDFNINGASQWEWFELKVGVYPPVIIWRGVGPPIGEQYGGDPTTCNQCHATGKANDFVLSNVLQLATF